MPENSNDNSSTISTPFTSTSSNLSQNNDDDDDDYGPIEAFVKTDTDDDSTVEEIDAENIDVLPTSSEVAQKARSKLRKYSILGSLCLVITITAVMVPLSLTVLRPKKSEPPPTDAPSLQPSQSPTTVYYTDYVKFFSQVSSLDDLTNIGSPQYRASRWIYEFDPQLMDLSHPRLLQRYIAAVFYYSTSLGDGWADCYPGDVGCTTDSAHAWFSFFDECEWYGFFECNEDGFVTRFVIMNNQNGDGNVNYGNNLHGTIPSELGYLTTLTDLTISKNPFLTSTIPSTFSKLTNLRKLRLPNNGLEGPWNEGLLQNMTNLSDLLLSFNKFDMPLPSDIANVKSLTTLALAGNNFHGKIPSTYKNLHRLKRLELHQNQLSGEVPSDLIIPKLEFLSLEDNNLVGNISDSVCNMTQIYMLKSFIVDCDEVECDCCIPSCGSESSSS